ncbi:hypothetical protein RhiirA1_531634 [Rhizophagus irregularis]|uniref:Uncharacterized protein n=5 Tax=Rhizophagus irregularis TaxID=588596 RepID=A0A2N0S8K4_9GLOM|nr:hypothetical protein GLOIN_2v1633456 [Rhizophagus irregularis DAOM 181602=DAOM 197198]EXX56486.1 hypothetical protein RirG_215820 [Rhizophagus irregularis DAOM 197198w]PKC71888.1 hypothetical protein RhiirA1_531634 [Rhizophagus irregularis]POG68731.1 hypothetical protein GLOIN_2v1633456 [Rhizophagus irregularis DAOM 181602=DAOM 197198]UZO04669.1 hypothetical protein OCT59_025042 [Rhizophagus irregularis]CAB4490418.1 unnamed protein product [Rhizophagus irregularis]|eukprot:XP_025175597.1 hypothetical protein GLOIN_2v1633456 [Rhizophagus irregularis DAOM 181602=DAOM 197198]
MKNRISSKSKPKITSSTMKNSQNNVKVLNIKRSDYLSYDDLRSMRKKVNELTTLNYDNEESNNINITDDTGDFMQDFNKNFEENYSGVISIATLFCTINKLFEDVGWKFSNYNKLDVSKCELTNLITKQKFKINISFDEGYEADIKEHRMKKKNEKPEYFHVYDNDESKYLYMNNDDDIKSKVVDLNDVKIINGVHDENTIDGKLHAYSAARTRIKRNLPDLQEEIYVILEEVSDEIKNRVTHFDDPFSLLKIFEENSHEIKNSTKEKFDCDDDQEYLTREYEKIENNSYHFVLVEGINNVNSEERQITMLPTNQSLMTTNPSKDFYY